MAKAGDRYGKWTLTKKITEDVWHVIDDDGRVGVWKRARVAKVKARSRFGNEVRVLLSLSDVQGVLPIIDSDPDPDPEWFVMSPAQMLADHLADVNFEVTVAAFAQLAETLDALQRLEHPVAHRDIKPDNLFWYDGRPVFGDFGVASWAGATEVTDDWEKVGPLWFLAPEAMHAVRALNWHAADVYSLMKSLWTLAAPRQRWTETNIRLEYPPPGQITDARYSLINFGGRTARELDPVIRSATADNPGQRPSAARIAEELRSWLRQNPGPHPRPQEVGSSMGVGFREMQRIVHEHTEATRDVRGQLMIELRAVLGPIEIDGDWDEPPYTELDPDGTAKSAVIMDRHGGDSTTSPHSMTRTTRGSHPPDEWGGALVLRFQAPGSDARLIVGAVVNTATDVDIIAERHHRQPDGTWALAYVDDLHGLHPVYPSTTEQLRQLINRLVDDPRISRVSHTWRGDRVL
ncbi:protein kinase [Nocardia fluminea]|uniref:protein kinase domain-containing protein n=1 Tax=Nocardia fluminea TaxID=134984 RepID=UPI0033EE9149